MTQFCASVTMTPRKDAKIMSKIDEVRFTLRAPSVAYARLAAQASRNKRSINSEILMLIDRGLEPEKTTRAKSK